jgi:hypothetical protein
MKVMKEHWSKEDALTLKRMKKKKWARLDEENTIVEFTTIDPTGRYHPDLRWIEVDHDTQWGTRINLLGYERGYEPTIGQQEDYDLLALIQKEQEIALNKSETKDKEPEISQFTANILPEEYAG